MATLKRIKFPNDDTTYEFATAHTLTIDGTTYDGSADVEITTQSSNRTLTINGVTYNGSADVDASNKTLTINDTTYDGTSDVTIDIDGGISSTYDTTDAKVTIINTGTASSNTVVESSTNSGYAANADKALTANALTTSSYLDKASSVSVATATSTNIWESGNARTGTYLINCLVTFANNTNGSVRSIRVDGTEIMRVAPSGAGSTIINISKVVTYADATKTIISVTHNAGSVIEVTASDIHIIKLK